MHPLQGLSQSQVIARRARGQGNEVRFRATRTYLAILRQNAFTFINSILFAIGLVLVLMGQTGDALVTAGLVLLNVVVGVVQEGRAKHKLDQIALLTRPTAGVVRDGQEQRIDPDEIVLDDLLLVRPGDQIVVDGQIVSEGRVEVDESLLTGESDRITKGPGDTLYSGSFCVAGNAYYLAQQVGTASLVNQLTAQARAFRQIKTPLQRDVEAIIRILVLLVTGLGVLLAISFALQHVPLVEGVRVAAVIVALVPQGLFFMTTVAYAMGALRVSGQGALIQQANAVESMSRVNLLCMDKTGTLTTNRIRLHAVQPLGTASDSGEAGLRRLAGHYVASAPDKNRTAEAIAEACGGQARTVRERVPFSSERKWSAQAFDDEAMPGVYVLGAPEVLEPFLRPGFAMVEAIDTWTRQGLRVVLLAHHPASAPLHDGDGRPMLPSGLIPLGLLIFRDELRPAAQETLHRFVELGIEIKVISGDNPQTVAALARQVGLGLGGQEVSGLELAGAGDARLAEAAGGATIFGRITPQQKEALVRVLRAGGRYVAMIGDGVNDVLSLKQAQLGVAMQSGSAATRNVADIVLLHDSFAILPVAFREGQRIVKGMEDVVRLLLSRTFYVMLLIIATQIAGLAFPVTPKHNSILALVTVGIPILGIAAWARPGPPPRSVIRSTGHFVFPAALTVAALSFGVYLFYLQTASDVAVARTALTTATVFCGLLLIPFVEPPTPFWAGGDVLSGDPRPTVLAAAMLLLYAVVTAVPPLRAFFELALLTPADYALLAVLAVGWALLLRTIWRTRLLERWFDLEPRA
jgi:cation-transporting ATPase E